MNKFERGKYAIILLLLILALLLGLGAYVVVSLHSDPVSDGIKSDQVMNTLFVIADGDKVIATEIVMYYPPYKRGSMFEIPVSTGTIFSSIDRTDRIEAVYREKGIGTYRAEIEKLANIKIPFTVKVELSDLCLLSDILGGFTVLVPHAVDIVEEDGTRRLLPHGAVSLDGDKLRDFVYYKLPEEEDSDVAERRQELFIAFLSAFSNNSAQMLEARNFKRVAHLFSSNLKMSSLNMLLSEIANIDGEQLVPNTVQGDFRTTSNGIRILDPKWGGQLLRETISMMTTSLVSIDKVSFARTYALEILNGNGEQGRASNTAILLRGAGYDVLSIGNADRIYDNTKIINHLGAEGSDVVKLLADFIHCKSIETEQNPQGSESASNVDFTLVIGRDFDGRYVR